MEDVFQATFLTLASKAGVIAWEGSVAAWLHAVARRLAMHARTRTIRRERREWPLAVLGGTLADGRSGHLAEEYHPRSGVMEEIERRDLRVLLDEALGQLPEKYRAPVVLCYLEGKTNEEAARQLGWPAGSISRRLDRARSLLKRRLAGAGWIIVVGLGYAALMVPRIGQVDAPDPSATVLVRQAMKSFRPSGEASADPQEILERMAQGELRPGDREQVADLARKSQWVAERIAGHDPGERRDLWQYHAARMGSAATELAQAVRVDDRVAMLGAARQLDATCIQCHETFRH